MSNKEFTSQMEKFCQGIADGLSQADSYRAAYPRSQKWKPETLYPEASKLMAKPNITTRIAELRDQLINKSLWTREQGVHALKNAIRISEERDNPAGVVAAVKELNAMHGYNLNKVEITGKDGKDLVTNSGVLLVPSTMSVKDWEKEHCKK